MPLLFSYGTLQQDTVQVSMFGRLLQGQPDALVGFEESSRTIEDPEFVAESGKAEHSIVKFNGRYDSRVDGTVFEVTDLELAKVDQYEPAGYERISATLVSGKQAWVYADTRPYGHRNARYNEKETNVKNFLILHYGFEKPTPEEMGAWNKWFESIADKQVDRGHLPNGRELLHAGTKDLPFGKDSITGYTVIEAENLDEAEKIAQECPIVLSTRVYEIRK